jgi:hypothetical protein
MQTKLFVFVCSAALSVGVNAFAEQDEWKPTGFPPLVLTVSAEVSNSDSEDQSWNLKLIDVQKNVWEAATAKMPDVSWPEVEWSKPKSTSERTGTAVFSVGAASSSNLVRVVDLNGSPVDREKVWKELKKKKRVLVSFNGKLPDRPYRQYLPAQSDLVVILGGNKAAGSPDDPSPNASKPVTRTVNAVDISKTTDEESRAYGHKLNRIAFETPMIEKVADFRAFSEGIWWVDRLAHAHKGNYLITRDGSDAFLIFTDTWLVTGLYKSDDARIGYFLSRLDKLKKDPKTPGRKVEGTFKVGGDFFGILRPWGKEHLVWTAYDWWVVYQRAK